MVALAVLVARVVRVVLAVLVAQVVLVVLVVDLLVPEVPAARPEQLARLVSVRVAVLPAQVARVVPVGRVAQVQVAVAQRPVHLVAPAANRARAARASVRSVKSGTTCKRQFSVCSCLVAPVKPFVCRVARR